MTLTQKQLEDICLINSDDKSKTCRYLSNDELDENKWYCQKLRHKMKSKIDDDVFISLQRHRNISPSGSPLFPCGDNCQGYPMLKHIQQGYDID
jgi:hypothetical protein